MIQDLDEGFQEGLRYLQDIGDILIPAGVYIVKYMSLHISLKRGSTTEVMNRGLDTLVIEATKI